MVIATFGPATGLAGKKITREGDAFVIEGHGPILPAAIVEYDRQGHLIWVNDGTRAWVGAKAPAPTAPATQAESQPASGEASAPVGAPDLKHPSPWSRSVMSDTTWSEVLRFRAMVTPLAIQVVFWLGMLGIAGWSVFLVFQGGRAIALGVLMFVFGSLLLRISCELIILLFRIYESLHNIEKGGRASVA